MRLPWLSRPRRRRHKSLVDVPFVGRERVLNGIRRQGALGALRRHGASDEQVTVYWVPGAFEIPLLAKKLVDSGNVGDAMICLGTLIRGATPHFDYIAAETTKGIAATAMAGGVPVTFGVLTTDTIEQAIERAGTKSGNKGWEAAVAAIEMANLYRRLEK